MIQSTLTLIEEQIGLKLNLCDYFTGVRTLGDSKYFNVVLDQKTSESKDYVTLERFANTYGLIRIDPNGSHRVAITPLGLETNF